MKKLGNDFKNYFKDYAEAQKVCLEFQKKHWIGNLIVTIIAIIGSIIGFLAYDNHKKKKEELRKKEEFWKKIS